MGDVERARPGRPTWLLVGALGTATVLGGAFTLRGPVVAFFGRPLDEQDKLASVVSMVVGIVALVVAVVGLVWSVVAARRERPVPRHDQPEPASSITVQNVRAEGGGVSSAAMNGDVNHWYGARPGPEAPSRRPERGSARGR